MKKITVFTIIMFSIMGVNSYAQLYKIPQKPTFECDYVLTNDRYYFKRCQSSYEVCIIYKDNISCYKK